MIPRYMKIILLFTVMSGGVFTAWVKQEERGARKPWQDKTYRADDQLYTAEEVQVMGAGEEPTTQSTVRTNLEVLPIPEREEQVTR